jgi:hypothetical protein
MPTVLELQGAIKMRLLAEVLIPRALASRELLKLFPLTKVDETELIYERRQVTTGLQSARGLGGPTGSVLKPGVDQWKVSPGYYGDHYDINENELINLREAGAWNEFENYKGQAARGAQHLTTRFLDRAEYSIGQLITTGGYTATAVNGVNYVQQIFDIPSYTPNILFNDLANSQPLNYFRDLIPYLELARSVSFKKGMILCSRPSANLLLKNQNPADLNGKRLEYGATINNIEDYNEFLISNDLPKIKAYDGAYYADPPGGVFNPPGYTPGTRTRFIPNGAYILIGVRDDGAQIGEYRLTRAAQNGESSAPGEWYQVEDRRDKDPCQVILRGGHNGGPVPQLLECFAIVNGAPANSFSDLPPE